MWLVQQFFVDHVSDYTYPYLMEDLTLNETLMAKEAYERLAATFGVTVKAYHSDNGRYADTGWQEACISMQQYFTYCGIGQHNQNGIAEKRIRDLSNAARACLLYAKQRWPEGVCTNLWPFALKYVCDIRNKVRIRENGKTAEEIFAQTTGLTGARLEHFHPFGCPAYVLDAKLQGGVSKIPRWDPRSRIGVYLGHSPYHAGSVALVLNLTTGHVSPQYHIVFDDNFSTVENLRLPTVPTNWTELNIHQREEATDESFQLSKEWSRDDSSDDAQVAPNNIDWLTTELNKPVFIPRSLENEGAAELDTAANEGAANKSAQVEMSFTEETVNDKSIATGEPEINLDEIKNILTTRQSLTIKRFYARWLLHR